jgi:putative PEP-CTERM system histidine kinase
MGQVIDIGNVISLKVYFPLIGATMLFGLGFFVLCQDRKAAVNQLFAAGMLALAGADAAWFALVHSSSASALLLWQRIILATHIVMLPAWYLFTASFGSRDFREGIRRQRLVVWGIGVMSFFFLCLVPTEYVIQGILVRDNGSILFPLGWAGKALMVASMALSMVILSNLETTYRRANRETRWKIEFLVLGLFGILGFQIFWFSRTLLNSAIVPHSFRAQGFVHVTAGALVIFSLVRHRLLNVDVFVSRYVVYRSLTLLLVGTYLFLLGIGRDAVHLLGLQLGPWASAALLAAASLPLAILLLTEGFQRRVKIFFDRHFYKQKYDYRHEWLSLTERLARAVTVHEVVPRIVEGLFETMWTTKAGILLLESDKTLLRLTYGIGFGPDEQVLHTDRTLLDYVSKHPEPIDVEKASSRRLGRTRAGVLDELRKRGVRIVAPMVARDEVLGFLVVGPEPSGQAFRPDDYDLCRTVAAEAATIIMNARMAEDLARGREIRAFAEMSSFVIHDIKNCANTLSLVASNAEAHIGKPKPTSAILRSRKTRFAPSGGRWKRCRGCYSVFRASGNPSSAGRTLI